MVIVVGVCRSVIVIRVVVAVFVVIRFDLVGFVGLALSHEHFWLILRSSSYDFFVR